MFNDAIPGKSKIFPDSKCSECVSMGIDPTGLYLETLRNLVDREKAIFLHRCASRVSTRQAQSYLVRTCRLNGLFELKIFHRRSGHAEFPEKRNQCPWQIKAFVCHQPRVGTPSPSAHAVQSHLRKHSVLLLLVSFQHLLFVFFVTLTLSNPHAIRLQSAIQPTVTPAV